MASRPITKREKRNCKTKMGKVPKKEKERKGKERKGKQSKTKQRNK
jgi:hypothetical protein